jgi:integrase
MSTIKLAKRAVESLKPNEGKEYFAWDEVVPGLGVRVTPSGRRNFVLKYRPIGQRNTRRFKLGGVGILTVEEARRLARKHLGAVANGADPARERSKMKNAPTVSQLGEAFLADVRVRRKASTCGEYKRMWNRHVVPALGGVKVAQVTTAEVSRLHRRLSATPYLANRVLAMLGSFFSFASKEGIRARHDRPTEGVEFFKESPRDMFLSPDQFRRLGAALTTAEVVGVPPAPQHRRKPRSEVTAKHRPKSADKPKPADPMSVAAIRLIALTGCREGEILSLRWDAVDFERGYLRLADSKTGRSVRPLGAAAAQLLASLPRHAGSPFVFPGVSPSTHLKDIKRLWFAVRFAANLEAVRMHDLRHSYASIPASGGASLLVIRALLGHSDVKTTQRYAHLGDDPVKTAADRTSNAIALLLNQHQTPVTEGPFTATA